LTGIPSKTRFSDDEWSLIMSKHIPLWGQANAVGTINNVNSQEVYYNKSFILPYTAHFSAGFWMCLLSVTAQEFYQWKLPFVCTPMTTSVVKCALTLKDSIGHCPSYLITSHWLKQVTWPPSLTSVLAEQCWWLPSSAMVKSKTWCPLSMILAGCDFWQIIWFFFCLYFSSVRMMFIT
jgi:hypothetical protein